MFPQGSVIINTGNVLNIIDMNKKAGQQVTEELTECLQKTLQEWKKTNAEIVPDNDIVKISRLNDDSLARLKEEDRKDFKIGIKIFIQDNDANSLRECLENVYTTLGIELIDHVVLAYNPDAQEDLLPNEQNPESESNPDTSKRDAFLIGLLNLWTVLEKYAKSGRILQIGVSDLEESCFRKLHSDSEIRPSIVQINLASCCVVPPGLQSFCKENDVQLLTHSDPQEIISKEILTNILSTEVNTLQWCLRYQVHIKCRGVLTLKGYILNAIL